MHEERHEPEFAPPRIPKDFMNARDYIPRQITEQDIPDLVGKLTPDMAQKSFLTGSPQEIAKTGQSFNRRENHSCSALRQRACGKANAGGGEGLTNRVLEVCRQLKKLAPRVAL